MKIKNSIPKTSPFLDFFKPLKQIKIKSFGLKTLLKTCVKTLERMEILALEILVKNQLKWGIYNPPKFCPLAARKGQK